MNFMIFGAGAVGSVVAARLADVHPVSLVARAEHVAAIRRRGLRVSGDTEMVQSALDAVTDPADVEAPPDVVLLTVKAYDTAAAVESLAPWADRALFVSLQNGLGNEEIIAARAARVLGAVINQGATLLGPGAVLHAGSGQVAIGPFHGTGDRDAETVAGALADAGFPAIAVRDINARIWAKAILNAAVNPLSALLRVRTGVLVDDDELRAGMRQVVRESVAIAGACGVELSAAEVMATVREVAEATRDNKTSMYQDLERGRRTEIEAINGALAARAREHGVPCPVNELLTRMVRAAAARGDPELGRPGGSAGR
jgi:2-dehydropantoate 2-reductase